MNAVEIRVAQNELPAQMGAMRVWLDEKGYESSGFSCADDPDGVQIRLLFKTAAQAQAFAEQFGGRAKTDERFRAGRSSAGIS